MKNIRVRKNMNKINKGMTDMSRFVKTLVLVVMMGCLGWSLFGNGSGEISAEKYYDNLKNRTIFINEVSDAGKKVIGQFPIQVTKDLGRIKSVVTLKNRDEINYIILKINDKFINPYTKIEIPWADDLYSDTQKIGNYSVDSEDIPQIIIADYWKGSFSHNLDDQKQHLIKPGTGSQFELNTTMNAEIIYYDLLICYNDGKYERIVIDVLPEFYEGEYELFNSLTGISKTEFALYSLNRISGINNDNYKSVLDQYKVNSGIFDSIDTMLINADKKDLRGKIGINLKKALQQNINFRYISTLYEGKEFFIPQLIFNEQQFDKIYGSINSPYIKAFFLFLYFTNKPVFSNYISQELTPKGYSYNYKDYSVLSEFQNKIIANNSLRYLTWGVEYTQYVMDDMYQQFKTTQPIDTLFRNLWLLDEDDSARAYNYLPYEPEVLESNLLAKPDNLLVSQLSFITKQENLRYTPFDAVRIDLWTSRNLAWEDGKIKTVLENENLKSVPLLFDKEISEIKTYEFSRNDNKEFSFGYQFNSKETVKSLGIVAMYDFDQNVDPYWTFEKEVSEVVRIKYKTSTDSEWITIDGKGGKNNEPKFFEYVSQRPEKNYEYDRYGKERLPGYGLYSGYPATPNDHLQISYLILNDSIECSDIMIELPIQTSKDKAVFNRNKLKISEIMIFPDNPLYEFDYIKEDNDVVTKVISPRQKSATVFKQTALRNNQSLISENTYFPFNMFLTRPIHLKQLVLWKMSGDKTAKMKELEFNSVTREVNLTGQPLQTQTQLKFNLEVPVFQGGNLVIGNPLPYAPGGIDSPRTFAYKMNNQAFVQSAVNGKSIWTTAATDSKEFSDYFEYLDEIELYPSAGLNRRDAQNGLYLNNYPLSDNYKKYSMELSSNFKETVMKPFLPGLISSKIDTPILSINSPYCADKVAGVDSLGILSGSISMSSSLDGIKNIFNTSIGDTLNHYFRMSPADKNYKGLDDSGNPVFYNGHYENGSVNPNSYLDERAYRLTREDLEKSSIIIPDISLVKVGDLLVDYNYKGEPHIGIIVGLDWVETPSFGSNIVDNWDSIIVLSIRRGFRTVTLGRWGDSHNGLFNGFTDKPKNYHIRRLLFNQNNTTTPYKTDTWEIFNDRIRCLETYLTLPTDSYYNEPDHLIPNTKEILSGIKIGFKAYIENYQLVTDLNEEERKIKILPPVDRFYRPLEASSGENSNMYANKGTGFEFYATPPGQAAIPLAKFILKPYNEKETADTRYNVIYDPTCFDDQGNPKEGYQLKMDDNGSLVFITSTGTPIEEFGIKVLDTIRPGDDILLRFGLINGTILIAKEAPQENFLAVYDKKMLWRANLYIDERKPLLGTDGKPKRDADNNIQYDSAYPDWNDKHPWNSTDNEWNYIYDGSQTAYNGVESRIQALEKGDGGQTVTFPDWTKYNGGLFATPGGGDGVLTKGAVAYASADAEPPFRFVWEILQQKAVLANKDISGLTNYDSTTAPESDWNNYIGHPLKDIIAGKDISVFTYKKDADTTINFTETKPYRPNLSAILYYDSSLYSSIAEYNSKRGLLAFPTTSQSSGLDCGAFVGASAAYGNRGFLYEKNPMGTNDWTMAGKRATMDPFGLDNPIYSWLIWGEGIKEGADFYDSGKAEIVKPIYPGDIVIFLKEYINGKGEFVKEYPHVSMVGAVKYNENGNTSYNDITLIEATSGNNNEYRVMNSITLYEKIEGVILMVSGVGWTTNMNFRRLSLR